MCLGYEINLAIWIVSMLDGDLFDRLARVACLMKKSPKPFGGIQVSGLIAPEARAYAYSGLAHCNWRFLPIASGHEERPAQVRVRGREMERVC